MRPICTLASALEDRRPRRGLFRPTPTAGANSVARPERTPHLLLWHRASPGSPARSHAVDGLLQDRHQAPRGEPEPVGHRIANQFSRDPVDVLREGGSRPWLVDADDHRRTADDAVCEGHRIQVRRRLAGRRDAIQAKSFRLAVEHQGFGDAHQVGRVAPDGHERLPLIVVERCTELRGELNQPCRERGRGQGHVRSAERRSPDVIVPFLGSLQQRTFQGRIGVANVMAPRAESARRRLSSDTQDCPVATPKLTPEETAYVDPQR